MGGLCIPNTFEGGRGLTETRGFYLSGGLLNSAKKKVSVLHNDLESKVQEVGGYAAKEKKQIRTYRWLINHPGSVHMKFYSRNRLRD